MRRVRLRRRSGVKGCLLIPTSLVVWLVVSQTAIAQTGARTRKGKANGGQPTEDTVAVAKKACSTGNYRTGVDLLADLYVQSNDPVHVFNQGRCYQQNNRYEEALMRFREFQRLSPQLPSSTKAVVDAHIAECEGEVAKQAERSAVSASPLVAPAPTLATRVPSEMETPAPPLVTSAPEEVATTNASGHGLRVAGITTALVGAVFVGAGVAFNIAANRADDVWWSTGGT